MKKIALLFIFLTHISLYSHEVVCKQDNFLEIDNNTSDTVNTKKTSENRKSFLTTHKLNYILPYTYDNMHHNDERLDAEAKFQISIKVPLIMNIFWGGDIYGAYTQKSLWQVYDKANSAPFRETNYRPEIFIDFDPKLDSGELDFSLFRFGFVHESNGQDVNKSRSWNKLEFQAGFSYENFDFGATSWYRFKEDKKTSPADPKGDDNPDLEEYIGDGYIYLNYKNDYVASYLKWQFSVDNIERGSVELNLLFPFTKNTQWMINYFNGYGESLIDYNERVNRVGIGLVVKKW